MRSIHDSICTGLGMTPGSLLKYRVEISHPDFVHRTSIPCFARGEHDAFNQVAEFLSPAERIERVILI